MGTNELLHIKNLSVGFTTQEGRLRAVRDLSLSLEQGESLGLVGESGSGKTVTSLAVMRLVQTSSATVAGSIEFEGRDIFRLSESEVRRLRGNEIAMIFQEPMTSLNPIHTCGVQIMEPLMLHKGMGKKQAEERALELMTRTGIAASRQRLKDYPHQLSGGMRQRVMIAMALACGPKLLIADEPTTALDVTIQAQILELMKRLRKETGAAILLITHDMGIVREICDRMAVMYAGQIVETAEVEELFRKPLHPYSEALLHSVPTIERKQERLFAIKGTVPDPFKLPSGCAFAPRCEYARERCHRELPELADAEGNRQVRCHFWRERDR
ncbi:MAG: ABC transporter ATP-binding protein [Treponema sp.]|jgi:oligopeptide/dipeptide ABC transporter ATP-binding protein|nr:ABC transporter ATP-binding protein [Treponema sp.]